MRPEEKFAGVDLKFIDPEDLETIEECAYVMLALDGIVASIEDQIGRAKSETARTGNYSNSDWFRAAERAMKRVRRTRVAVQNRRGVVAQRERDARNHTREQAFIEAAKLVLDKETYLRIWSIAVPVKET